MGLKPQYTAEAEPESNHSTSRNARRIGTARRHWARQQSAATGRETLFPILFHGARPNGAFRTGERAPAYPANQENWPPRGAP